MLSCARSSSSRNACRESRAAGRERINTKSEEKSLHCRACPSNTRFNTCRRTARESTLVLITAPNRLCERILLLAFTVIMDEA